VATGQVPLYVIMCRMKSLTHATVRKSLIEALADPARNLVPMTLADAF
jgi:hypothetical protein